MTYVIVTNASNVVVGKNVYAGNASSGLSVEQAKHPELTFTTVDENAFNQIAFVGPNYASL